MPNPTIQQATCPATRPRRAFQDWPFLAQDNGDAPVFEKVGCTVAHVEPTQIQQAKVVGAVRPCAVFRV